MSKKKRPNSRRPGSPQTRATTREASVVSTPLEADTPGVEDGEQLPPVGAFYPQTLLTDGSSRARSIFGLLIAVGLFLVLTALVGQIVVLLAWVIHHGGLSYQQYVLAANRFDLPAGMLAANLSIALLIPISMGLVGFVHRVRPRWLSSVRPRLRWRYLFLALIVALVALGGVQAVVMLVGPAIQFHPQPHFWVFLVIIVLTSPLQAAGEEYFFRGYLMQALGSLVARPWFAIIVSSVIFALAHTSLDPALFADRLIFGLLAALLVRVTGGLEAGIAAHIINNILAFTLAGLTSSIAAARGIRTISWANAGIDVGSFAVFALLAWLVARVLKLQTRVAERA